MASQAHARVSQCFELLAHACTQIFLALSADIVYSSPATVFFYAAAFSSSLHLTPTLTLTLILTLTPKLALYWTPLCRVGSLALKSKCAKLCVLVWRNNCCVCSCCGFAADASGRQRGRSRGGAQGDRGPGFQQRRQQVAACNRWRMRGLVRFYRLL